MNKKNKTIAQDLTKRIRSIAYVAEHHDSYISGTTEALDYYSEFIREVYNPLIDFDEEVEFVSLAQINKMSTNNEFYFNGKYVKIIRKTDFFRYVYYVYCSPVSKLKTCYNIALKQGFDY